MDFEHIYFWLRIKFLKGNLVCDNLVITHIMEGHRMSKDVAKFCFNYCTNFDASFHALKTV